MRTEQIRVRGTVQGVGFRPTVYRLAKNAGLKGDVCKDKNRFNHDLDNLSFKLLL